MKDSNTSQKWSLFEVWGDTADAGHLAWAIVIGLGISLSVFLIANRLLAGSGASASLARAYAMLAGLGGCVLSGIICAVLFKPKREVIEGGAVDSFWRQEVLEKLAEQYGGLGSVTDLPQAVVQEMKELEIYELFASFKPVVKETIATGTPAMSLAKENQS